MTVAADPKPARRIVDGTAEPIDSDPIDRNYCPVCDKTTFQWHRHHVVNRSQGGDDVPENLCWLCPRCHDLIHTRRGGRGLHRRFVRYCRVLQPELGRYADRVKFDGWLERRYA